MAEHILNLNRDDILSALKYGDCKGYVLFPEIREQRNVHRIKEHALAGGMLEELLQYASDLTCTAIPDLKFKTFFEFAETGNRLNYEKIYFESKRQLHALVIAELCEESDGFIDAIEERLWKWCDTYSWELPSHVPLTPEAIERAGGIGADESVGLFASETTFYFAEILSLIGNKLNPLIAYRLAGEIERRVLTPFKNRTYWWERSSNNWASVCAGSIGCAAIYSIKDADELSALLYRVTNSMECFLSGFDNDGVTTEGLLYWNYGFSFFVYYSELLKERTCGQIDLLRRSSKLRRIAELPLYLHFPDGHIVSFSDVSKCRWEGNLDLLSRLASVFGISYRLPEHISIFQDSTSKWAVTSRSLFWITEKIFPEEATKTGMFFFPESQWLIDRRLIPRDAPEAAPFFCSFAAKGGNNGESHNHNDLGHFILFCDGDILFADLGAPEYTKKYFSVERYNVLHASSRGHSVPLIDGREQEPGSEHAANVLECSENGSMVRFGLDLCKAYDDTGLGSFHRIFEWDYNKLTLNITDEFVFENQKNNIQEVLITLYEPVAEKTGRLLIKGGSCTAVLSFDAGAKVTIIKDKFRNHYGEDASAYRICLGYETEVPEFRIKAVISVYNKANPSG